MMKRHEVEKMFKDKIDGMSDEELAELSYELDLHTKLMWDEEFGYFLVNDEINERWEELEAKKEENA